VNHPNAQQASTSTDPQNHLAARALFWENAVRETLTSLMHLKPHQPELFDGRIAILTHAGERIPIADVSPMFACSILGSPQAEQDAQTAVALTVFLVSTPAGELYTLPIQEIRAIHTLTPDLIRQLEQLALQGDETELPRHPFGLAAARKETETPPPIEPDTNPPPKQSLQSPT